MELTLNLDPGSATPLYQQIYTQVQQLILMGKLAPGQRVPATRALAQSLGVARATVTLSYDYLLSEGYLEATTGAGTFVARQLPEDLLKAPQPETSQVVPEPMPILSRYGQRLMGLPFNPPAGSGATINFRYGCPDRAQFPQGVWRRLLVRHSQLTSDLWDYSDDPLGYGPLREALCGYLVQARGMRCSPDQILLINGSQQGLDLIARVLVDPGDRVAMEEPGYRGAARAFRAMDARLCPVPVDRDGLRVDLLPCPHPRLVYLTPSHQFPTGGILPLARRLALLSWAVQGETLLIEDDYDSEFRYGERPVPALQGLDQGQRVLYVGTFSKILFPALRVGYLVVPKALVSVFARAKGLADRQPPALTQAVLTDFIVEGHLDRHLRRMRTLYNLRREVLVGALREVLGDRVRILGERAGIHVLVQFDTGLSDQQLCERAAARGVGLTSIASFYLGAAPGGEFLFGYSDLTEDQIVEGVRRLGEVV